MEQLLRPKLWACSFTDGSLVGQNHQHHNSPDESRIWNGAPLLIDWSDAVIGGWAIFCCLCWLPVGYSIGHGWCIAPTGTVQAKWVFVCGSFGVIIPSQCCSSIGGGFIVDKDIN